MTLIEIFQRMIIENHELVTLLNSNQGLNIYIQIILAVGTILIGLIAFIVSFLAFNSNRKAIKRKNIHSEIAFYNKQIESYYVPISKALKKISEAVSDYIFYFKELEIEELKSYKTDLGKLKFHQQKLMAISNAQNNLSSIIQEYEYLNTTEINHYIFELSNVKNELEVFQDFFNKYSKIGIDEANYFILTDSNINYFDNEKMPEVIQLGLLNYNYNFDNLIRGYACVVQFWINIEGMIIRKAAKDCFVLDQNYLDNRLEVAFELVKKTQIITSIKIPLANRVINQKIKKKYRKLNKKFI